MKKTEGRKSRDTVPLKSYVGFSSMNNFWLNCFVKPYDIVRYALFACLMPRYAAYRIINTYLRISPQIETKFENVLGHESGA
jgi:hypothetical protein